ncbi:hypothetical protein HYS92_01685 [Candidatus Daviesbacteria bacterium]|nr:hypothetical protein [Candidatus Daviesbacteria bacterium]
MTTVESRDPANWLFNKPTPGIAQNWYERNLPRIIDTFGIAYIRDNALVLNASFETWTKDTRDRYTEDQVVMTKTGPVMPPEGSQLWDLYQEYTNSAAGKADFNGSKLHLYGHSRVLTDTNLILEASAYDWHRMRILGMGLREGRLPLGLPFDGREFPNAEAYRDTILPRRSAEGYVFDLYPNNMVIHVAITTSDNKLIVTQKPPDADYYPNGYATTIEEQIHGVRDKSPFDTLRRSVNKVGGEELKLTLMPEHSRIAAMILEPDVSALGFIMTARVTESSGEINAGSLGADRAEFDPSYIRAVSLDDPKEIMALINKTDLHGTTGIRTLAAYFYYHGYEEGLNSLYPYRNTT